MSRLKRNRGDQSASLSGPATGMVISPVWKKASLVAAALIFSAAAAVEPLIDENEFKERLDCLYLEVGGLNTNHITTGIALDDLAQERSRAIYVASCKRKNREGCHQRLLPLRFACELMLRRRLLERHFALVLARWTHMRPSRWGRYGDPRSGALSIGRRYRSSSIADLIGKNSRKGLSTSRHALMSWYASPLVDERCVRQGSWNTRASNTGSSRRPTQLALGGLPSWITRPKQAFRRQEETLFSMPHGQSTKRWKRRGSQSQGEGFPQTPGRQEYSRPLWIDPHPIRNGPKTSIWKASAPRGNRAQMRSIGRLRIERPNSATYQPRPSVTRNPD